MLVEKRRNAAFYHYKTSCLLWNKVHVLIVLWINCKSLSFFFFLHFLHSTVKAMHNSSLKVFFFSDRAHLQTYNLAGFLVQTLVGWTFFLQPGKENSTHYAVERPVIRLLLSLANTKQSAKLCHLVGIQGGLFSASKMSTASPPQLCRHPLAWRRHNGMVRWDGADLEPSEGENRWVHEPTQDVQFGGTAVGWEIKCCKRKSY